MRGWAWVVVPALLAATAVPAVAAPTTAAATGEGLLSLTMSAPGTSWADPVNTSLVVEASVDGGQPQTVVLFAGARPFTYRGFTGPLRTGRHTVSVRIRRDLSQLSPTAPARLALERADVEVVRPGDPRYLPLAHVPVLYERTDTAHSDTPLLTDVRETALPHGAHRLVYTTVWSNEDAGSGMVPAYLWGSYGRMTDIETTTYLTVDAAGRVTDARYLACSRCPDAYPEQLTAVDETVVPFTGRWFAGHPVLRVATGNNDMKDSGTTPYRTQQAPIPAPPPTETREAVMDAHPWTYRVMDEEIRREHAADRSTDPRLPAPGSTPQYAVVDIDADAPGTEEMDVEVRLSGDPTWYASDYRTLLPRDTPAFASYPFYRGGHGRTVVKLPLGWQRHEVVGLRLRLDYAPGTPQSGKVVLRRLRLLAVAPDFSAVTAVPTPAVQVTTGVGLPHQLAP